MQRMITLTDIELARANIKDLVHHTPLIPSVSLSKMAGRKVFLKEDLSIDISGSEDLK